MNKINNIKLLLDNQIETDEFGIIYLPTVLFLKEYGEEGFNRLIFPFALTVDILDIHNEYKKEIKVFDLFFQNFKYSETEMYYCTLMKSLGYFFRSSPKYDKTKYCINVGDKVITRDNFDSLASIILQISKAHYITIEKPPKFENDIQKDIYYKIIEGRKKKNEKNVVSFATMINVAMNCGNSYVSSKEINQMTIFQLMSRYEAILGIDSWDIEFSKYVAGSDPKDLDLNYWVNKVKI